MKSIQYLALLAALVSIPSVGAEAVPPRPNILFIAVDDLRPELGCYGMDYIKSPNIDRIAKNGIVFNRAYCQQAVCSPTRSSLMTGTRPDTTQVYDLETHFRKALPDVVTLGQHFKQNGYFVQGMGKIYHGNLDDAPTWSVPCPKFEFRRYALKENRDLDKLNRKSDRRGPAFEAEDVADNVLHDGKLAELAVSAMREMSAKQQPFFLAVGFTKPHLPFVAPKRYWDLYNPTEIKLATTTFRPRDAPAYSIVPGGELRKYHGIPAGPIPDDLARQLKHGYYASISYMDAQVGMLLDALDRLDLSKNTIVILWGDHGWKLGEHDAWCKHSNVENDTKVPLILSVPGRKGGVHSDALVEVVDIYPTLTELAGLALPEHLEGTSFVPLLENPGRPWKSAAFSQYPRNKMMGYSMRSERYRFTAWLDRLDHTKVHAVELYDHQTDPQENENIAKKPENEELIRQLGAQLKAGWKSALPN